MADNPKRIIWLTGPNAGKVEPPFDHDPNAPLHPAMWRLIDALAEKCVDEYLEELRKASSAPLASTQADCPPSEEV